MVKHSSGRWHGRAGARQPINVTLDDATDVPQTQETKNTDDVTDDDVNHEYFNTTDDITDEKSPEAKEHPQSWMQEPADDKDVSIFSRNAKTSLAML